MKYFLILSPGVHVDKLLVGRVLRENMDLSEGSMTHVAFQRTLNTASTRVLRTWRSHTSHMVGAANDGSLKIQNMNLLLPFADVGNTAVEDCLGVHSPPSHAHSSLLLE